MRWRAASTRTQSARAVRARAQPGRAFGRRALPIAFGSSPRRVRSTWRRRPSASPLSGSSGVAPSATRAALERLLELADERGEPSSYALQRLHVCELELRAGGGTRQRDSSTSGPNPRTTRCSCGRCTSGAARCSPSAEGRPPTRAAGQRRRSRAGRRPGLPGPAGGDARPGCCAPPGRARACGRSAALGLGAHRARRCRRPRGLPRGARPGRGARRPRRASSRPRRWPGASPSSQMRRLTPGGSRRLGAATR